MKKQYSKETYKVAGVIAIVASVISFLTIILFIPGIVFLLLGINYLKTAKKMELSERNKFTSPPVYRTPPITNVPPEKPKAPQPSEEKPIDETLTKTYKVAGVSFRQENIKSLAVENTDYEYTKREMIDYGLDEGERIYKYEFYPTKTELIPEPDNPHDPNAVKVVVDDEHIGYIKAGSAPHVLKLLKENRIKKISCEISGGPYKYLEYDIDEDTYSVEKEVDDFYARVTITETK